MTNQPPKEVAYGYEAQLERAYIEDYLRRLGYSLESIKALPEEEAKQVMRAASLYASTKLSEVENRSHLVEELHGTAPHGPTSHS